VILTLGIDPSRNSSGIALCTPDGPLWATNIRFKVSVDGKPTHSFLRVVREQEAIEIRVDESCALLHRLLDMPHFVCEQAPPTYNQKGRGRKHGAGAAYKMGMGLGGATDTWCSWAARYTGREPVLWPVAEWRRYWSIGKCADRDAYKAAAVRLVKANGWGGHVPDGPASG